MPQLVTRLDDALLAEVDRLVKAGVVETRSEAVRVALRELVARRRRAEIGQAIVDEYTAHPQTEAEYGWSDAAAIAMIAQEPW
jgi:metal-responsive CopG/Arc/MetJ family transcriptional regulator